MLQRKALFHALYGHASYDRCLLLLRLRLSLRLHRVSAIVGVMAGRGHLNVPSQEHALLAMALATLMALTLAVAEAIAMAVAQAVAMAMKPRA